MIDLPRLKAAVVGYDDAAFKSEVVWDQVSLVAAARAVLDGQDVEWCEKHDRWADEWTRHGYLCPLYLTGSVCDVVKRRLVTLED